MAMARASGAGPAPNPNSRRQQRGVMAAGWIDLPNEGCKRKVPAWPLGSVSPAEAHLWSSLWATPQAEAWHATATSLHDVALYVRIAVRAMDGDEKAYSEARQWSDRLGLNPPAMARLRWRMKAPEVGAETAPKKRGRTMLSAVPDAVASS